MEYNIWQMLQSRYTPSLRLIIVGKVAKGYKCKEINLKGTRKQRNGVTKIYSAHTLLQFIPIDLSNVLL